MLGRLAAQAALVAVSRGCFPGAECRLLIEVAFPVAEHRLQHGGFGGCDSLALEPRLSGCGAQA